MGLIGDDLALVCTIRRDKVLVDGFHDIDKTDHVLKEGKELDWIRIGLSSMGGISLAASDCVLFLKQIIDLRCSCPFVAAKISDEIG